MLPLRLRALKVADRLLAPGLLSLAARLRRPPLRPPRSGPGDDFWSNTPVQPGTIGRILVIRPGGIGDAALAFPLLNALRAHFGQAAIDVLAERRNAGLFEVGNLVSRVLRYDDLSGAGLRSALASPYDLVIDTEQYHRLSTLVAFLTRAPFRCGFDTLGRGRFLTHRVRYREGDYEVYSFLNLAAAVIGRDVPFDPQRPFMQVSPQWDEWAGRAVFDRVGDAPVVVMVPETGSPTRVWPAERYRAVVEWLLARGCAVCLLGGHESAPSAGAIAHGFDPARVFNLAARTTLPQSCGILKGAALYLGTDCGVLHIAVALGIPTVHMFGSGIQEKWAPIGPNYSLIDKRIPCSPCTRYGYTPRCPYRVACMSTISIAEVIAAVGAALASGSAVRV